jgi:hypothetical protein
MMPMLPCPCCGYEVFSEPPGSYEICPICFWEDDIVQLAFPNLAGGANKCSLIEGQSNYLAFGACEARLMPHVRAPTASDRRNQEWRQLDTDRHLNWDVAADHELWQSVKHLSPCLYYWSKDYFLAERGLS